VIVCIGVSGILITQWKMEDEAKVYYAQSTHNPFGSEAYDNEFSSTSNKQESKGEESYSDVRTELSETSDVHTLAEDDFEEAANKQWEKRSEACAKEDMKPFVQKVRVKLKQMQDFSSDGKDEVMDWNMEFQELLEDLWEACAAPSTVAKDWNLVKLKRSQALSSLAREFLSCAELFAETTIREQVLPEQFRTVKSATSKLKGIAGGSKFVAFGILFKFMDPKTARSIYETEENAIKSTKLDFQGCAAVTDSIVSGIRTPLMSLITYRGHRILAMSILPIEGEGTQVYGTANAGAKVLNEDEKFNDFANDLARSLNLKSHITK
jgi:hypothetical protein